MKVEELLQQGLQAMGLDLPAPVQQKLLAYRRLLDKWNRTYNLTAVREAEGMVTRHLLDSLSVLPYLQGLRVLDVGTGAGLPGIPLALARPDLEIVLLDSKAKKIRFVTQAAHELGLKNVAIVHTRVEKYLPAKKFDTLITRAFASIPDMLTCCRHLGVPGGLFLVMKGVYPREELAAIGDEGKVTQVKTLHIPGLDAARHLVIITWP